MFRNSRSLFYYTATRSAFILKHSVIVLPINVTFTIKFLFVRWSIIKPFIIVTNICYIYIIVQWLQKHLVLYHSTFLNIYVWVHKKKNKRTGNHPFILVSLVWELKEYINSWKYTNIINTYNYMKTILNVINIRILYFQSIHHFMVNIKK